MKKIFRKEREQKRTTVESNKTNSNSITLKSYNWGQIAIWTIFVAAVLLWNLSCLKNETLEIALNHAISAYEKDLVNLRWAANHGEIYVPVTKEMTPNNYLSHVAERDIITPSGRKLTLINHASMTNQVIELSAEQYGLRSHITSINPISPENSPDLWEKKVLSAFERSLAVLPFTGIIKDNMMHIKKIKPQEKTEICEVVKIDGESYLRLMRPMMIEKSCLKCHAAQGYQVGDIHGGISVSVPMAPLLAIKHKTTLSTSAGYFLIWVLGLVGIIIQYHSLESRVRERERAEV